MTAYTEKYRTGSKRFVAAIVDMVVFMPLLLVEKYLIIPTSNQSLLVGWVMFTTFLPIIYSIVGHWKYGQTIGKWVVKIKVLDISETKKLTLVQSILRDGFYLLIQMVALVYYAIRSLRESDIGYLLNDFNDFVSMPLLIWTLLELVTMLTNDKRRAIHDLIAKSVVIRSE